MRWIVVVGVFLFLTAILTFCNQKVEGVHSPYLNLADSIEYVGMQTCRSCHPDVYETFTQTGMGLSFDTASVSKTSADFSKYHLIYDTINSLYYRPFFKDSIFYIEEFRLAEKDTVHKRVEKVDYIVGSGQHTNSHILSFNGYIYQAPITYYTQEKRWDMAPGFRTKNQRFSRLLNTECITCHNHFPNQVEGSHNKFTEMPKGIECERCHGPGEIHRREKLAGNLVDTSKYIDYSIVNPANLSRDLQMDLCQRCHLQGVAVLNEGKTFFDFKPGMALSDVMNVYLPRYTNSHEKFIMASQADRLRMSDCYQNSETLSCLTCHNPHHSVTSTNTSKFNDACINCHQENKDQCAVNQILFDEAGGNCVSCHMPRSGSVDIPHVNITDHNINRQTALRKYQPKSNEKKSVAKFLGIESLTKDDPTDLEMAQGYLALYDKFVESPVVLDSAKLYLDRSSAANVDKLKAELHYFFVKKDYQSLIKKFEASKSSIPNQDKLIHDWTAYRIGQSYLKLNQPQSAIEFLNIAAVDEPLNLEFLEKKAVALIRLGKISKAKTIFEFVLSENPKRKLSLSNLGFLIAQAGDLDLAESYYDQAIGLDPDYVQALLNKAAVRLYKKDTPVTIGLLKRILLINPSHEQAMQLLEQLEGSAI